MATSISYAPGLPQAHKLATRITRKSAVVRTDTGAGTIRTRLRFTTSGYQYSDRLLFTTAELSIFDTFFVTTLAEGSRSFNWIDPRTGNTVEQLILEYPEFTEISIGVWEASATFEILPV